MLESAVTREYFGFIIVSGNFAKPIRATIPHVISINDFIFTISWNPRHKRNTRRRAVTEKAVEPLYLIFYS